MNDECTLPARAFLRRKCRWRETLESVGDGQSCPSPVDPANASARTRSRRTEGFVVPVNPRTLPGSDVRGRPIHVGPPARLRS